MRLVFVLSLLLNYCHAAIVDLLVITGEHSACPENYDKVQHKDTLNGDMNEGAKGEFIWLCVMNGPSSGGITSLSVVASDNVLNDCGPLGGDWHRIKQDQGSNGDFNQGAHGNYIYLCYSKTHQYGSAISSLNTHEGDCDPGMARIGTAGESNGDFNQGAKGKYIYLCFSRVCSATGVTGQWEQRYVISAPTQETWMHGTEKKYSESKSEEWSQTVTAQVGATWSLLGAEGSVSITKEVAHETSQSYQDEWSVNDQQTFSITWGKEDVGKQAWQFVFYPTDSCGHTEETLVKNYALTEGAFRMPCCAPGYGIDMPFYTTCFSKDVMVPGVQGCKVKGETNETVMV
jgi:hypothetical protein